jgi:hypothetical protein
LPKKIQFDLLLADLAFQRRNAPTRRIEFAARRRSACLCLARSTGTAQSLGTARKEAIPPDVQIFAGKPQLAR